MIESTLINNKKFLQILKEKLARGNKKSIHLNVLPGRSATRLDLLDLDLIKKGTSERFINALIQKKQFKVEISFDENFDINDIDEKLQQKILITIRRLKSICKQNTDYNLEHGIQPFGFGYPIIYKRDKKDPTNVIKAPLIIWSLEIIEDRKFANKWIIKRDEDFPISFNDVLISHIEKDEGIKIDRLPPDYLEDSLIDENEIDSITINYLSRFGSNVDLTALQSKLSELVESTALLKKEDFITSKPEVIGGGIFGLYISQKQSIIQDIDLLMEESFQSHDDLLLDENFKINPFSSVDTDPSQQRILSNIPYNSRFIVHGPPGTGKSQSISAILPNALANHSKCLVVCEKRTALDVIYNNLKEVGLEQLCGLIEDTTKDRRKIVDKARETIDNIRQTIYYYHNYHFDEKGYSDLLESTKTNIGSANQMHQFLSRKLIGRNNWTDLVGEFLKNSNGNAHKILDKTIPQDSFLFCDDEFNKLLQVIEQAKSILNEYNPVGHPFCRLKEETFLNKSILYIKDIFETILPDFVETIDQLADDKKTVSKDYQNYLLELFSKFYDSANNIIKEIDLLSSRNSENPFLSDHSTYTRLRYSIISIFSNKYKAFKFEAIKFRQTIESLRDLIRSCEFFYIEIDYRFKNLATSSVHINYVKKQLKTWQLNWETITQDKANELSTETIIDNQFLSNRLNEFFTTYNLFIENFNASTIFTRKFDKQSLLGKSNIQLLEIKKQLLEILESNYQLDSYLSWIKFYHSQSDNIKILLSKLTEQDPSEITKIFKSWYFNRILNSNYEEASQNTEHFLFTISECLENLKSETTKKALTDWQQKRINSIYKFDQTHSFSAKQLFAKTRHHRDKRTLRQIIEHDFKLFTDIFPVLLVNPSVCSSLFKLQESLFDIVIFDESSQLRIEDTFCALIRGKIRIVAGDEHQMPPSSYFATTDFSIDGDEETEEIVNLEEHQFNDVIINLANKESLLEFATDLKYEDIYLQIHYRSRHPLLINFSNAAFYGNRLNPLPAKNEYKPIRFIHVNGLYENQINVSEARQVVDILRNHINENPDGELPSVGIATFNIHQRNLIWDEINKEAKADYEFGQKIDKLYENGLFIKNLENIQGDERDIIIISTTFGKNEKNDFNERFGPLNVTSKGHRLLNVIITRAKHKLFVCTSFPIEKIQQYREYLSNLGNIGRGILYAYLAYAKAVEEEDYVKIHTLLEQLSDNCNAQRTKEDLHYLHGTESPFENEVVDSLIKNGVPEDRMTLQHQCGGFRIDIVIKSKKTGRPVIAIECDGASYHDSQEAFLWDIFRQKQLEQFGLKFYRIWSTNWWINPSREIKKTLDLIEKFDLNEKEPEIIVFHDNLIDEKIEQIEEPQLCVTYRSLVLIENIKRNTKFKIRFTSSPQNKLSTKDGIQYVYEKAPIANSLIGKRIGDVIEIEISGELFKVIDILEN